MIDADADRLLVNNASTTGEHVPLTGDTARIVTRGSGASTTVFTDPLSTVRGQLTSDGALLVTEQLGHAQVRQLRNGTLSTLTDVSFINDLEVEGDFATWLELEIGSATRSLVWRDLAAGTSDVVATSARYPERRRGPRAQRRPGRTSRTERSSASGAAPASSSPTTRPPVCWRAAPGPTARWSSRRCSRRRAASLLPFRSSCCSTPGGDIVLGTAGERAMDWTSLVNGGLGGVQPLRRRRPCRRSGSGRPGGRRPSSPSSARAAGSRGSARTARSSFGSVNQKLFRVSPGSAPTEIAGQEAEPIFIGGVLHVMVGDVLFRVD